MTPGPFTVTHRQTDRDGEGVCCSRCSAPKGRHALGESCNQNCGGRVVECAVLYREAFATLEDDGIEPRGARTAVADLLLPLTATLPAHERRALLDAARELEPGGTIKLPGSEIEVEAVGYERMFHELSESGQVRVNSFKTVADQEAALLAAWNAEHGIGPEARA